MKDFKDIDIKNSPFLKLHMEEQRNKTVKQFKQADKDRRGPILQLALVIIFFFIAVCLDPLAFRFIFQGY